MNVLAIKSLMIGRGTPAGILCIGVGMLLFAMQDAMMMTMLGPYSCMAVDLRPFPVDFFGSDTGHPVDGTTS